MDEVKKDFLRFLRHEAMFRNINQSEVLTVIINIVKDDYEVH